MTPNSTVKQSLTVPLEPTEEMLDVAVSFALNVSLSGEYNLSTYMRDVWQRMVKAAPPSPDAELVELLREAVRVLDGWKSTDDLDALQERIDAKLASLKP